MSTTTATNSKVIDDLMSDLLQPDGFNRMEYEEMYPELFSPLKTHRPMELTDEQIEEKGEA